MNNPYKKTLVLQSVLSDPKELESIRRILSGGGLVVVPTETVYGLGANAQNEAAVKKIFVAKGRPQDNPLIVHIHDISELPDIARDVPESAIRLFEKFSPGPLTIVLKKNDKLAESVSAGLPTVAVRIPSHPVFRKILEYTKMPIAAPSANRSGRPSPTDLKMALAEMDGRADAVADGGECEVGLESTVIAIEPDGIHILRPGAITEEMLREASDLPVIQAKAGDTSRPRSPGTKYTHYKPDADVYLAGKIDLHLLQQEFPGKRIGVMMLKDNEVLPVEGIEMAVYSSLSEYARKLYGALVEMDSRGVEVIVAQAVPKEGIGRAIMNRLEKAAGRF